MNISSYRVIFFSVRCLQCSSCTLHIISLRLSLLILPITLSLQKYQALPSLDPRNNIQEEGDIYGKHRRTGGQRMEGGREGGQRKHLW